MKDTLDPAAYVGGVIIPVDHVVLHGDLVVPPDADAIVVFAHGSGSGRRSPRNRQLAESLHQLGFATLLVDLLTIEEELEDRLTAAVRFDIPLLATRLEAASEWVRHHPVTRGLRLCYFGASTGTAAALMAAAALPGRVIAIVSRGGRPDLVPKDVLERVHAPTLLIVGGYDQPVVDVNRAALPSIPARKALAIIARAAHLFEERGAMDEVARRAGEWFRRYAPRDTMDALRGHPW
jgi:putative phosphoribosyl transferase